MNYCVHSIMYFYYFIMIFPSPKSVRKVAQTIAPLITTIQILQMVGGIIVTATGAYQTINNDMRDQERYQAGREHRLPVTVYLIQKALKTLYMS